eukprot:6205350-Pleurochrysis_carterae.AAC.2
MRLRLSRRFLQQAGDDPIVITPDDSADRPADFLGMPITYVRGFRLIWYKQVQLTIDLGLRALRRLQEFRPDVMHVAAPGFFVVPALIGACRTRGMEGNGGTLAATSGRDLRPWTEMSVQSRGGRGGWVGIRAVQHLLLCPAAVLREPLHMRLARGAAGFAARPALRRGAGVCSSAVNVRARAATRGCCAYPRSSRTTRT